MEVWFRVIKWEFWDRVCKCLKGEIGDEGVARVDIESWLLGVGCWEFIKGV